MNNKENTARILVELGPSAEEGKAEIGVTIEGTLNNLLNGLDAINAHILKMMINDAGKEIAMQLYAAVQMSALEKAGISPEAEIRASAAGTFAALAHIFGDFDFDDEEEEAE